MIRRNGIMTASAVIALLLASPGHAASLPGKLRHGYVDDRYGQLHYVIARPVGAVSAKPPIILFHQSPNSSAEMLALVAQLGKDRVAIGVDTPGHGASDGPDAVPTIEDYAAAVAEALAGLGYGQKRPVDLFGYHTGSKIATELAVTHPEMVRKVILSGYYDPPAEQVAKALANTHNPASATEMFEKFAKTLPDYEKRYAAMGVKDEDWGRVRLDSMRGMTRQEYGHIAAFTYAPKFKARSALVTQPVLLAPMDDGLAEETKAAAANFKHATVTPRTYSAGALFTQAGELAEAFRAFLDH